MVVFIHTIAVFFVYHQVNKTTCFVGEYLKIFVNVSNVVKKSPATVVIHENCDVLHWKSYINGFSIQQKAVCLGGGEVGTWDT